MLIGGNAGGGDHDEVRYSGRSSRIGARRRRDGGAGAKLAAK
jgi:hypothetical protein